MSWYRTGTITVTNGSPTITGLGTSWIANAAIGEGVLAPDNRIYEIVNIASDTSLTLGSNYLGSTSSGQTYVIVPTQSYIRDLAAQAATLINNYSTIYNTIGQGKFAEGTLGAPAVSFQTDTDTGFYHSAANEVTFVAGGVAQFKYNTSGISFTTSPAFATPISITANTTSDALRITQLGSGNAILVEDSANPDATPFVVEASGNTFIGRSSNILSSKLLVDSTATVVRSSAVPLLYFARSEGTDSAPTIVGNGGTLQGIYAHGYDGANYILGTSITSVVDGTPGTNDMPGRLVFSTTADGASSPTERMRIDSAGRVGIGGAASSDNRLAVLGTHPSSASFTSVPISISGTIPSTTTASFYGVGVYPATQAAAFTLVDSANFFASGASIGAGSSITNQYGFYARNTLTGATNNYGFYGNIPSGTGRYNFYANGTADNYFAGNVLLGNTTSITAVSSYVPPLQISTGNTNNSGIGINAYSAGSGTGYINFARSKSSTIGTNAVVAADDNLGGINFTGADGTAFIRAAQIGAYVDGTPGANDMPGRLVFLTAADGSSSPTERMRIDSAGKILFGITTSGGASLRNSVPITGQASAFGCTSEGLTKSDVTSVRYFHSQASTETATFTLTALSHFNAASSTFGVGSTVTNQYGFNAGSSLTGATNNYGFYGSIPAGTGRYNFYAAGTADNYFAGKVGIGLAAGAGVKARIANDRAVDSYSISLDTYNGASFENSLIVGFNGSSTFLGNFQSFPLNFITNNVARQTIAANGTISLGAAPGAESLRVTPVASAVNYLQVGGSGVGDAPYLYGTGSDADVGIKFSGKGSASTVFYSNTFASTQFVVAHTASAVNYIKATGGIAGSTPKFTSSTNGIPVATTGSHSWAGFSNTSAAIGVETDITSAFGGHVVIGAINGNAPYIGASNYSTTLNNGLKIQTNGTTQFFIAHTASAVNYLQVTGSTTGSAPSVQVQGSDTNIDLTFVPKGTGNVRFGTLTANADAAITGYITIKDAGGTLRKLAVIA